MSIAFLILAGAGGITAGYLLRGLTIGARSSGSDLVLRLPPDLDRRLREEAARLETSREQRALELFEYGVAPAANLKPGVIPERLSELREFLAEIAGVEVLSVSEPSEARWWVMIHIDLASPAAWHVVQGLAFVLNGLSLTERLPTTFKPVSPPPYLNGGPEEFLDWIAEASIPFFDPAVALSYLKQRLPRDVSDPGAWLDV